MTFFLFLVMLCVIAGLYITYNNKISNQKRQIILLSKQNNQLKNKLNNINSKFNNIEIKFIHSEFTNAVVNTDCPLYIAPINNSLQLNNLQKDCKLKILDCADVLESIWYEVIIDSDENENDNINNKGWIKEEFITKIQMD